MKIYFVKFTHLASFNSFYKFGITGKTDVLERFNSKYDERYNEFMIQVLFSAYGTKEQCERFENKLLKAFPKNFDLEYVTAMPYSYYTGMSGITETVMLEQLKVNKIVDFLKRHKDSQNRLTI